MYKQVPPLSPQDGSQGDEVKHGDAQDQALGLAQDSDLFSFALHALSEMNDATADTHAGYDSLSYGNSTPQTAANFSTESEDERIKRLQSALDSYKDWLSSI